MNLPKKNIFYLSIVLFVLSFVEFSAYIAMRYLENKRVVYRAFRNISETEYKDYLNKREQLLGWPMSNRSGMDHDGNYDKSGSRLIPAFPDPDKFPPCVSLYGDSYTYGAVVSDEDSWGNILSTLLNCRVSNYGVVAYGTDQEYMRFFKNVKDKAPLVILGYLSENILRNINQYRALLYCNVVDERFALKPRFVINKNGELDLVPMLKLNYQDFLDFVDSPEKYLKDEYFIPGGKAGIYRNEFPHIVSLWNVLSGNFHIKAKFSTIPWYAEFYDAKHPSNALAVTFNIMKQFHKDADNSHKRLIVLMIPTVLDLEYYNQYKRWPYENLTNMLLADEIEFIDAGPGVIEYLRGRKPRELFFQRYHFNKEGEAVLAQIVYAFFKDKEILGRK
jgi:hypothetical protein